MLEIKKASKGDNLLILSALSFFFIASTALMLSRYEVRNEPPRIIVQKKQTATKDLPLLPVLNEEAVSYPIISAQAVLAIDLDSSISLYEKNPDERLLPASTTKIMTALVAMDYFNDSDVLTVNGMRIDGRRMGLIQGEEISAESLLDGLLVYSANDAAEVLADNYDGGKARFVSAMNTLARRLSLTGSRFENPTGYDGSNHYTTARDLVRAAEVAMRDPKFAEIVVQKEKTVSSVDNRYKHRLTSTNELLGSVEGVLGVKTGWTKNARENLVTYLERDGEKVMIAVLGSQDRFGETRRLIDWIFDSYQWKEIAIP